MKIASARQAARTIVGMLTPSVVWRTRLDRFRYYHFTCEGGWFSSLVTLSSSKDSDPRQPRIIKTRKPNHTFDAVK